LDAAVIEIETNGGSRLSDRNEEAARPTATPSTTAATAT